MPDSPQLYDLAPHFSVRRIYAMVLRYLYLLRGSWPRIIELSYWPMGTLTRTPTPTRVLGR